VIPKVNNMVPEGRGTLYMMNEDHSDTNEDKDDNYANGNRQAEPEPDLPPNVGLEPGELDDLEAENMGSISGIEPETS
jgi:hypothetical protein